MQQLVRVEFIRVGADAAIYQVVPGVQRVLQHGSEARLATRADIGFVLAALGVAVVADVGMAAVG